MITVRLKKGYYRRFMGASTFTRVKDAIYINDFKKGKVKLLIKYIEHVEVTTSKFYEGSEL